MEIKLLFDLDFKLFITPTTYLEYKLFYVNFSRPSLRQADRKPFSLSMHPDELKMLTELSHSPLYQSPVNTANPFGLDLLTNGELTVPAAAAAGVALPTLSFNSNQNVSKNLPSKVANAPDQPVGAKILARKTPSSNTTITKTQAIDADGPNEMHRKKQKITKQAYDPRFLASVFAPSLPTEHIFNKASAPNPGFNP